MRQINFEALDGCTISLFAEEGESVAKITPEGLKYILDKHAPADHMEGGISLQVELVELQKFLEYLGFRRVG